MPLARLIEKRADRVPQSFLTYPFEAHAVLANVVVFVMAMADTIMETRLDLILGWPWTLVWILLLVGATVILGIGIGRACPISLIAGLRLNGFVYLVYAGILLTIVQVSGSVVSVGIGLPLCIALCVFSFARSSYHSAVMRRTEKALRIKEQ